MRGTLAERRRQCDRAEPVRHRGRSAASTSTDVEQRYLELVEEVRAEINVPLAVKLGPVVHRARPTSHGRLQDAGADGLVLFNRLLPTRHRPRHARRDATPASCRTSAEARLPLHWIGILRGIVVVLARRHLGRARRRRRAEAAARRCRRGDDHERAAAARARSTSRRCWRGCSDWMTERDYDSVEQLQGQRQPAQRRRTRRCTSGPTTTRCCTAGAADSGRHSGIAHGRLFDASMDRRARTFCSSDSTGSIAY